MGKGKPGRLRREESCIGSGLQGEVRDARGGGGGQRVRVGSMSDCGITACLGIFLANVLMWDGSWAAAILYNALRAWHTAGFGSWTATLGQSLAGWCRSCTCIPPGYQCVTDAVLGRARSTCTSRLG